jgi:transposase
MYIDIVPNRGSKPAILLRETHREGEKVIKHTLANLSSLSLDQVEAIRRILKGEKLVQPTELFEIISSAQHGIVEAVLTAMRQLEFEKLIASRTSRERDLVVAMVAARIMEPDSKLATTRWWQNTTLPDIMGVSDATEVDLYEAMDWLLARQDIIEKKLSGRHLTEGGLVLYDLTSSYFEGKCCPLAALGHNRDGKKGKLQVNYGLLTDSRGAPVAVSVFKGNTGDPKTLMPQVEMIRKKFGITEMVLIGDRGMISQKHINDLKGQDGINWITAMKSSAIQKLVNGDALQLGLFDERNLFEFTDPDYPGERLIACRNPELAKQRDHKRQALLDATNKELDKVKKMVESGRLKGKDQIGVRVGKVVNKYKMAKHLTLEILDNSFNWQVKEDKVTEEGCLDGVYVIRTSLSRDRISSEDTVRRYKDLSQVEQAFRSFKSIDLEVRPIQHHLENRVRAHIFLCMLAYYVKLHMQEALRPLTFADEDLEAKQTRDPVAPAKRSKKAIEKARTKKLKDGTKVHSFQTLLNSLNTIVRNVCRYKNEESDTPVFNMETTPSANQQKIFNLLRTIKCTQ